jgi:hypothetical protein
MPPPATPSNPANRPGALEHVVVDGVLLVKTAPILPGGSIPDGVVDLLSEWAEATSPDRGIRVVVDLTETHLDVSAHELRRSAFRVHQMETSGRLGICVVGDFQFGMTRMFGILCEGSGLEVRPFRQFESAFEWVRERDQGASISNTR